MNQMYGFDGEVKAKYSTQMAELFTEVYNWLPLAHCLNNKILVSMIYYQKTHIIYIYMLMKILHHHFDVIIMDSSLGNARRIIFAR